VFPVVPESHPKEFKVEGKPMACPVCKAQKFWSRRGLLNTRGLTFMEWDWANRGATQVICSACGHILWFADPA
jgi:hypothetical protein